jgi:hypothetical protein
MTGQKNIVRHFPHFFQTGDTENLFYRFVEVFGAMLDAGEDDLLALMRAHWVETADNEGSKGFDTNQKGDLDKILALYLEALGGTSLLRQINRRQGADGIADDAVYRERMLRLIQILREGASHIEGIREIVAANLGIFGDSEKAANARSSIEIIEYLPQEATIEAKSDLHQVFWITNPNPEPTLVTISIKTLQTFASPVFPFRSLQVEELTTQRRVVWTGNEIPGDQNLEFVISGLQMELNGDPIPDADIEFAAGLPLILPPGASYWRIRSIVGEYGAGTEIPADYPQRLFNDSLAIFAPSGPLFEIRFHYTRFHPATFMVRIPWHIPGYSEQLDAMPDKPRLQIPFIVQKVKGAGIWGVTAYRVDFKEEVFLTHNVSLNAPMPVPPLSFGSGVFDIGQGFGISLFQ